LSLVEELQGEQASVSTAKPSDFGTYHEDQTEVQEQYRHLTLEDSAVSTDQPDITGFEFKHRINRGGYGEIWLARDRRLDRDVAVNVLRKRYRQFEEHRAALIREAVITGKLENALAEASKNILATK